MKNFGHKLLLSYNKYLKIVFGKIQISQMFDRKKTFI